MNRRAKTSKYLISLVTIAAGICSSCKENPPASDRNRAVVEGQRPSPASPSASADGFPVTVVDGLGRRVTLPRRPDRIVSLAPKNTELLFALGADDRVVGVTSYCNYPPAARTREQIGGFSAKSQSVEKILALKPDLVAAAGELHESMIAELERLRIPVVSLGAESLAELDRELVLLGRLTGRETVAARLTEQMKARVARVTATVESIEPAKRATVFYHVWSEPLTAAGPKCYLGELISLCGGINIINDVQQRYPHISQEILLARDPDVILAPSAETEPMTIERLKARPGWSQLKAVRSGRIYLIDGDLVSRCGPRLVDALEIMARSIYPDRFPTISEQTARAGSAHEERRP
jgi:iron complex transport system substrate-binding protein